MMKANKVIENRCVRLEQTIEKSNAGEERRFQKRYREKVHEQFSFLTKNMLNMIIENNHHKHWKEDDIAFAISVYNSSSRGYNYLREEKSFPFPSRSCVLDWMKKIEIQPGIVWPVLEVMMIEFSNFTLLQRAAILSFDEMYIDGRISWDENTERIIGPHKNIMVVTVRSIAYQWKQIVFFDFDYRLTKESINQIITQLYQVGVHIYGMVSDMSTINRRVWKELGINVDIKK
jgi:hypothetical protein